MKNGGKNCKISIALATYNGSEYIAEQLQSLLNQTRCPDEIVITDDSPDERTYCAIKPFLPGNIIRYFHNDHPLGVTRNFEQAIKLCSGDLIFLCDQDDVWLPEKIRTMSEALLSDDDIDAVFCNSTLVDESLHKLNRTLWQLRGFSRPMQKKVHSHRALAVFLKRVCCSSHNLAFKRRALEQLLPFPELEPFYPDSWIGLSTAAANKIKPVDEELTLYRIHSGNQSAPGQNNVKSARKARSNQAALRNALLAAMILQKQAGSLTKRQKAKLQCFEAHHRHRAGYHRNLLLRALQIAVQLLTGNYFRYANGLKTAAADLIFRAPDAHK